METYSILPSVGKACLESRQLLSPIILRDKVVAGKLGMKTGEGFFRWTQEPIASKRKRYNDLLRAGLKLLADELPKIEQDKHSA